ncbi:hypothetical protein ScPMuIL_009471 [Solemya velum]
MPTDSRRITGPETSQSPHIYQKTNGTEIVLIDENKKRQDGRGLGDIRPMFLRAGIVSQARGSAYMEQNQTKVICAVYGPREIARREEFSWKGQITCEFKFATFSCLHRRQPQQDGEEKDFSVQLLEALEPAVCLHKFPKSQVNVYVTVLQDDGSALAAAITCASVALADAAIEMYDLVTGCSARISGGHILLDPCHTEEYRSEKDNTVNNGSVTLGLMPSLRQVSAVTSKGELEFEHVKKAMDQCLEVCQKLYPVLQQSLIKSVKEKLEMDKLSDCHTT